MGQYDVIISGGGPAGSSAAWQAASAGAKVLLCDRAVFPRDKPCGDGLTPRAVRLLSQMGLGTDIERFHRVGQFKLVADAGIVSRRWPNRVGLPPFGYVAPRTELDAMLVEAAAKAGAEVRTAAEVVGPIVEHGTVVGVRVRGHDGREESIEAKITIAADGMSSRLCGALGMKARHDDTFAVAVRAQVESKRFDDDVLECHVKLRHEGSLLPGYAWVFPMGGGRINIGLGYMTSYKRWRELNANELMTQFVDSLPVEWELPSVPEMVNQGVLNGWRLPMGLAVWPPWRPGLMAAGDAIGAAKPFTGAGISKAIQTGTLAAQAAVDALAWGSSADLSAYEAGLDHMWGAYYRIGRQTVRLLGNPLANRAIVETGVRFGRLSDFFVTLFTGDGGGSIKEARVHNIAVGAMMRLASLPGARPIEPGARAASVRTPTILERRTVPVAGR